MTPEDFAACFDRFKESAFRLETLQRYTVPDEAERIRMFREGRPRPERSVRTSPWLRRVAVTTAAGKHWQRVHVVDHPLSEYLRYELVGYVESAAAGEEVGIADRATHPDLARLTTDFWLFDADSGNAFAVPMNYDDEGHLLGYELAESPEELARRRSERDLALAHSVSLNEYLAMHA
jgi:hypothetical protein